MLDPLFRPSQEEPLLPIPDPQHLPATSPATGELAPDVAAETRPPAVETAIETAILDIEKSWLLAGRKLILFLILVILLVVLFGMLVHEGDLHAACEISSLRTSIRYPIPGSVTITRGSEGSASTISRNWPT